jgi:quinol monooxygenase YgiN
MRETPTDESAVIFINVFTVEPLHQERLVDLLSRATEGPVCQADGFLGATLHRGMDGTKVTMYARWRSFEDYQAMRGNPAPLRFLQEALTFAKFEPGMYEAVRTFRPSHRP